MFNLFLYVAIPTGAERARHVPARSLPPGKARAFELKNVSFRYPGREAWALRKINLTLAPGEKLGLVGENGAGKSTLVKLLLRLYEPTEAEILYVHVTIPDPDPLNLPHRPATV